MLPRTRPRPSVNLPMERAQPVLAERTGPEVLFGQVRIVFLSYRPRPKVVPTREQPDAPYSAPVYRGVAKKVSIGTGTMP